MINLNRIGISLKTAVISSVVVIILLAVAGTFFLSLESSLVNYIMDSYVSKVEKTFDTQAEREMAALDRRHKVNVGIMSGMSAVPVNYDSEGLAHNLKRYMELPDIIGIKILDSDGTLFLALWKVNNKIGYGTEIPENVAIDTKNFYSEKIVYNQKTLGHAHLFFTDELVIQQLSADKKAAQQEISVFQSSIDEKMNSALYGQAMAFFCVIIALIVTLVFTLRVIVINPVKNITAGLQDIAEGEGDLTKRLEVKSQDEVGQLCKWFNTFVEKIHAIVQDVSDSSNKLNQSAGTLSQISEHMTQGAQKASVKTENVKNSTESMSAGMNNVAAAMEQTTTNIDIVASAAEEMSITISEIAQNTEKARGISLDAVTEADNAKSQVAELGLSAKDVGKVLETISEISEQVNLLALNATIEAARAGDAGKGFAVVANEIKELARQTAEATDEIRQRVENMQSSTEGTVQSIGRITDVVNVVNEIVATIASAIEEQSSATGEIANNVSQASSGLTEVNQNVAQNSSIANTISDEISKVSQEAGNISNSSEQVNLNADDLSTLAGALNKMVGRFKI